VFSKKIEFYLNLLRIITTRKEILLKYLKFSQIQKIILLDHQNNYLRISSMTSNVAKNVDTLKKPI